MKKRLIITVLLLLFVRVNCFPVGFSIIDVVKFLTKVTDRLSGFEKEIEKYQKDFKEYYNKYWKNFNRKFFPQELDLLKMEDPSEIYKKSYIDPGSKREIWKNIFENPEKLWKKFRYIGYMSHYKDNELYKKNRAFRVQMDKNLKDMKLYLKEVEKSIRLIGDTRRMQKKRGEKISKYKLQNDLLGMPKVYWEAKKVKLLTFGAMLDYEIQHQIVELIMLMNARTELKVKGEIINRNMTGREKVEGDRVFTSGKEGNK